MTALFLLLLDWFFVLAALGIVIRFVRMIFESPIVPPDPSAGWLNMAVRLIFRNRVSRASGVLLRDGFVLCITVALVGQVFLGLPARMLFQRYSNAFSALASSWIREIAEFTDQARQRLATAMTPRDTQVEEKETVSLNSITILVHGVDSDAEWYPRVAHAMRPLSQHVIVPFTWGDYAHRKQGGYTLYAADQVNVIFRNPPTLKDDRVYQGHSAIRLKELIDECNKLGVPVNVIAHSNGTILTLGALLLGARLDNLILMGSPHDVDNHRSQVEFAIAITQVRGRVVNFWSSQDWPTLFTGGIGHYAANNGRVENVEFVRNKNIKGVYVVSNSHSDYMLEEHMDIFVSYIKEFAHDGSNRKPTRPAQSDDIQRVMTLADWTQTDHYLHKTNVTMNDPAMKRYKRQINAILQIIPPR